MDGQSSRLSSGLSAARRVFPAGEIVMHASGVKRAVVMDRTNQRVVFRETGQARQVLANLQTGEPSSRSARTHHACRRRPPASCRMFRVEAGRQSCRA